MLLFESSLEEMQEGKETVDLSSVVKFTVLNSFFVSPEKTKLGFQPVEQLLKNFQDYSV